MLNLSPAVLAARKAFEASCGKPFYTDLSNGKIWFNGHVCLCKDPVFGLCVYTGSAFTPMSEGTSEEIDNVKTLIHKSDSPIPFPWTNELDTWSLSQKT